MTKPNIIYLDLNALNPKQWPEIRGRLTSFLALSDQLGIAVSMPRAVVNELEAHVRRNFRSNRKKVCVAMARLNELCGKSNPQGEIETLLSEEYLESHFGQWIAEFTSTWNIQVCGLPSVSTETLFRAANEQALPVESEGKGFKDAVIFCSVLEDLAGTSYERAILITDDAKLANARPDHFGFEGLDAALDTMSLEDGVSFLRSEIDRSENEAWERDQEVATEAARRDLSKLVEYVERNLDLNQYKPSALFYAEEVSCLTEAEVGTVETPTPIGREAGDVVRVEIPFKGQLTIRHGDRNFHSHTTERTTHPEPESPTRTAV